MDERTGFRERLDAAREAAGRASEAIMQRYRSPTLGIERKADGSIVTEADEAADAIITETIRTRFPDDAILTEESGQTPGRSGWRWVVDPLDGTASFVRGLEHFVVLIGCEHRGRPRLGVAEAPALGECVWTSTEAAGRWRTRTGHERDARVSAVARPSEALVEASSAASFAASGHADTRNRLATHVRRLCGWTNGYAFMRVATGRVEAAISVSLAPWDIAATIPIIESAGGRVTTWSGGPAHEGGAVIGSNGSLHEAIRGLLHSRASR